jgi:CheY-like chemotaxis protein
MPPTQASPGAQDFRQEAPQARAGLIPDLSRAMVIGRSPITCVVVAKIAERAGLKPVTEQPETAAQRLAELVPGLIIIDGGVENRDCDHIVAALAGTRLAAGGTLPATILLSNANTTHDEAAFGGIIDAVVAKPITPENLQPVIERLMAAGRG